MSEQFFVPLTTSIEAKASHDPTERIMAALDGELLDETTPDSPYDLSLLRRYVDRLPAFEADLVELRLLDKTEKELAGVFGMTQAAISYRLCRAYQRVRFLSEHPDLTEQEIRTTLAPMLKPASIDVMVWMFKTSSQSRTAKLLGSSQGKVRHRFFTSLDLIREIDDPMVRRCWKFLDGIRRNPNILIECDTRFWRQRRKPPGVGVIDL